jgi:hypothetical protein
MMMMIIFYLVLIYISAYIAFNAYDLISITSSPLAEKY